MRKTLIVAVAAAAACTAANAEIVLVDLGNNSSYRGASVPGGVDTNGNSWNSVWSGAYYAGLVDSTGSATTINLGFDGTAINGTDSYNGPAGTSTDPADSVYNAAALGMLGADAAVFDFYVDGRIQIQNLDPTKTYNLTFYGSHKYNDDNTTRYSIYTDDSWSTVAYSADLVVGVNDLHNEDLTVSIMGVTPQAFNIIYLDFSGANGGSGYLNAFSIEVVPAPSALALLGFGAVATRRRR